MSKPWFQDMLDAEEHPLAQQIAAALGKPVEAVSGEKSEAIVPGNEAKVNGNGNGSAK